MIKRISFLIACILVMTSVAAFAAPEDPTVFVSATASKQPLQITLSWVNNSAGSSYSIYRKMQNEQVWGNAIATMPNTVNQYVDTNIEIGVVYEYRIDRLYPGGNPVGAGFVFAAVEAPLKESQGTTILVVDSTKIYALEFKINRLIDDLICDGFKVEQINVLPTETPQSIKLKIKEAYDKDPLSTKSVFLLGNIPIVKSGCYSPDGHGNRPFPADAYYGSFSANWTDTATLQGSAPYYPSNLPDDGQYDYNNVPANTEIAVGRADMSNIPAFAPKSETYLLGRYLDKVHEYRRGRLNLPRKTYIHEWWEFSSLYFGGYSGTEVVWTNTPKNDTSAWKRELMQNQYLFSYIDGPGAGENGLVDHLFTSDFVDNIYQSNFVSMFGSYIVDWSGRDSLLRGFLAMKEYGLTNYWGGFTKWYTHSFGMGNTYGDSVLATWNKSTLYGVNSSPPVHTALMGDPNLRIFPVAPVENLTALRDSNNFVNLSWDEMTSAKGYNVYSVENGISTKINTQPVSSNHFKIEDTKACTYMVRTIVLQDTGSGSYYDMSVGAMVTTIPEAINISIDNASYTASLSGTINAKANDMITLVILRPDGSFDCMDQKLCDSNGNFTFIYKMSNVTNGRYTAIINGENLDQPYVKNFYLSENVISEDIRFDTAILPSSGTVSASVAIKNISDDDVKPIFLMEYKDKNGILKDIKIESKILLQGQQLNFENSIEVENKQEGDSIRAYIWDGFERMQPVSGIFVLN